MNGAESAIRTAVDAGVRVCFANPGTTEMPLVAALDAIPGTRSVLCLFEGVCTGAADGYARCADRPALTLVHLGPGLGNGIANLHNARRARSPVVNLVGEHATWMLPADPPLASDIASLARAVSGWQRTAASSQALAGDMAAAIAAAGVPPGQVATLIIPADCQWGPATGPAQPVPITPPRLPDEGVVEPVARALRSETPAALLLGGTALRARGLRAAARITAATNCRLISETFPARTERGAGLPAVERLAYFPEAALEMLTGLRVLVLAGAAEPVPFFGYEGKPARLTPDQCALHTLARPDEDAAGALERLADALGAPAAALMAAGDGRPEGP